MVEERPELSKAEWAVMNKVWDLQKTNVREVCEELRSTQNWAYNTVRTLMERLREKGYLSAKKVGNTFFYRPRVPRRRVAREAVESFADKVFDGAVGPIVSHLIREDRLSPSELKEIRHLLEREDEEP